MSVLMVDVDLMEMERLVLAAHLESAVPATDGVVMTTITIADCPGDVSPCLGLATHNMNYADLVT